MRFAAPVIVVAMAVSLQQVDAAQGFFNTVQLAGEMSETLLTSDAALFGGDPGADIHHGLDQRINRYAFQIDHYGTSLIQLMTQPEPVNVHDR